jgi:hypothetical protein
MLPYIGGLLGVFHLENFSSCFAEPSQSDISPHLRPFLGPPVSRLRDHTARLGPGDRSGVNGRLDDQRDVDHCGGLLLLQRLGGG